MAKYVGQLRYYGNNSDKNYPKDTLVSRATLSSGAAFYNTLPIVQLGVQTLPGMKIYINNHTDPIVVGQTGIYELNVDGFSYITDLKFDNATLNIINNQQSNTYLIVDYVYEKEE